jgi:two-component system phosphate regulon sensor histidine kinase PhoR
MRSILTLDSTEPLREAVRSALSGINGYYELSKNDKHYSVIVTPVKSDGIIEGAVIVIIDDTEKEERDVLRREFTSNVSHELKTPLTSISGFAELIKNGLADGEDAIRFADNIHKESKRLIDLVGDIIRLTQLDGGEIPYDGEVELSAVCHEAFERLASIAEKASVKLVLDVNEAYVYGNLRILGEIVYNLTDNAIKYNRPEGQVIISSRVEDECAVLSVRDNGIGIPKEKQDRVFERFYRVDKSHSKEIGGTGLGLSIVKHAAAYHKAKITLISEEYVGTEIKIQFPRTKSNKKDN